MSGLIVFGVLRLVLGHRWGQMASVSGMSFEVVRNNVIWLPLALAGGIKGGMLLFLGAGLALAIHRSALILALAFALTPCLLASLLVYDLTRSLAFGFPAYFLAMVILRREVQLPQMRRLMLCAALGCAVLPTYWVLLRVYCLLPAARWL
jgi:hypothetical protein